VLPELLRSSLNDAWRGDDRGDRGGVHRVADFTGGKPAVLRRRTVYLLCFLGILGILYGSLAPFQVDRGRQFGWGLLWHPFIPSDAIANVLVYVPMGVCLRLMVRRRGSIRLAEYAATMAVAGSLSYLVEACQTVLAYRVASWLDVICNVSGAAIGASMAPTVQRVIRNQHAALYLGLRSQPYGAAAAATLIVLAVAALMPFDVHPTMGHLGRRLHMLAQSSLALPWTAAASPSNPLTPLQNVDKLIGASAFGFGALILVLAGCEAGRLREAAVRYALTRMLALATVIELLQLFTVAHVADPRDLLIAWAFCGLGAAIGSRVIARSRCRLPQPANVLRGLVLVVAIGLAGRGAAAVLLPTGGEHAVMSSWLPMATSFHRPWDSLLGAYLSSLAWYGLFAGSLVLSFRAARRVPRWTASTTAAAALVGQAVLAMSGQPVDTAHIFLALLAGGLVQRADRALFGPCRMGAEPVCKLA